MYEDKASLNWLFVCRNPILKKNDGRSVGNNFFLVNEQEKKNVKIPYRKMFDLSKTLDIKSLFSSDRSYRDYVFLL